YERGLEARGVIRRTIRAGRTAQANSDAIRDALAGAGFRPMEVFNQAYETPTTDIMWGNHSVGNLGHGVGPSVAFFNPERLTYEVRPTNLLSIELFAYTPVPEWDGAKVRIPLEDDAVVTERGVEWLYPPNERILLIR
ncbi:MAG: aminopeptidase P family protein, partial [Gemmatimonadota bacterium]|nr:aminopeptidase P family protein [Gemmatimonadota bacterium]